MLGLYVVLLRSWTFFNKLVSNVKYEAIVQEYPPVNSHPPDYPTCKYYLDFLPWGYRSVANTFHLRWFRQDGLLKIVRDLWKNRNKYTRVILLMGRFHQLRVIQRLLYKIHFLKRYRDSASMLKQMQKVLNIRL